MNDIRNFKTEVKYFTLPEFLLIICTLGMQFWEAVLEEELNSRL